jgi:hypothetical protein
MTVHEEVFWFTSNVFTGEVSGNFVFLYEEGHSMVDFTHVIIRFNRQKSK